MNTLICIPRSRRIAGDWRAVLLTRVNPEEQVSHRREAGTGSKNFADKDILFR